MDEQVFYEQGGYRVTNTMIDTPGKTYSLANITSVSTEYIEHPKPGVGCQVILVIIGGIMMIAGFASDDGAVAGIIGLLIVGIGIAWIATRKQPPTEYVLKFASASSEQEALRSTDYEMVTTIATAVKQAIVARG